LLFYFVSASSDKNKAILWWLRPVFRKPTLFCDDVSGNSLLEYYDIGQHQTAGHTFWLGLNSC
jgi:hypothetical protein